jgi:endonuclease I
MEWWTKAYSRITTLESCLNFSSLHVSHDHQSNRQNVITLLQARYVSIDASTRTDAELVAKCALLQFTEPNDMKKLSGKATPVSIEPAQGSDWWWEDTEGSMSPVNSTKKVVDGDKGSGWVLVLQIADNISGSFQYDSELWTNYETLNSEYTRIRSGIDVKLPSYNTQPLSAVRVCVESLDRCYSIEAHANSSRELFSGSYRRRDDINQNSFEAVFGSDQLRVASNSTQCMQRPGFNTQCKGGNKARFGFCGNLPAQPCQPNDNDDADFAIGIGLSGQANGRAAGSEAMLTQMGAGYTDYFADNTPGAPGSSSKSFQAWVFVLARGSDIRSEIFPPSGPSYIHVNRATCAQSHWIQLDLGEDFLVGRIHRWFYFSDRAYCNQKIELSQTGIFAGEEHVAFTCDTYAQCGHEPVHGRVIDFESVQARFVRYYVSRNSLDASVGHFTEIEVYGWSLGSERDYSKISQATLENDSVLVLNVSKTIFPGELVEVVIPSAFGLTIPQDGIRHNASNFGLASNAALGPVTRYPLTPLTMTIGVGSFSRSEKLEVTPRRAGTAAAFTLSFTPKMRLQPDETVSFVLRHVAGPSSDFCVGPTKGFPSVFDHGSWFLERHELVLTVGQTAMVDVNLSVVIPSSVGLFLPATGIGMNTDPFTVSANVRDGSIPVLPPTYVVNRPAIGFLSDTRLSFDDACSGESIPGFDLSFRTGMDILVGEQIFLTIPGFMNRHVFTCVQYANASNEISDCSTATCAGGLCPGTSVAVTGNSSHFTQAEWIHPDGLDDTGMYVIHDSAVNPTSLSYVTAWMSVHNASMYHVTSWHTVYNSSKSYDMELESVNRTVHCGATNCSCSEDGVSSTISPWSKDCGCACRVVIAECSASNCSCSTSETSNGVVAQAVTHSPSGNSCGCRCVKIMKPFANSVLMLEARSKALAGSNFSLRVHVSPEFVLPARLVDVDIDGIALQCNARQGPVLPTRVDSVLGLGKFKTPPTLDITSRAPQSSTTLIMSFELSKTLQPLSTIEFFLPGFKHLAVNASSSSRIAIEGSDAVDFGYFPVLPCNVIDPTVFVGCDWSPTAVEMNTPGLCYSVHCPRGCNLDDNVTTSVYGQCSSENDVFFEGQRFIETGYEPFSSSICSAGIFAGVIGTDGGTLVFTRINPTNSELCAGVRNGVRSGSISGALARIESAFQVYPRPFYRTIDWSENLEVLSMPVGESELAGGRKIAVSIPDFVVPRHGIRLNSATASILEPPLGEQQVESLGGGFLTLPPRLSSRNALISEAIENQGSCNTKRESKRLLDTVQIGWIGKTGSLMFSPRFPGATTNVTIEFTPGMDIGANEFFLVRLPGFGSNPFSDTPWLSGKSAHQLQVSWSNDGYILNCTVRPGALLPAREHVSVTILRRAVLRLPLAGITDNDSSRYTIEFHTHSPLPPQRFSMFDKIGSFTDSPRLSFSANSKAGTATEIFASFVPEMPIEVGEDVTLTMPNFQGPAGPIDCTSVPAGVFTTAAWDPALFSLRMIALERIHSTTYVSVSLAARIAIPLDGVRLNQPDFMIATNAWAGPLMGQSVPSVASVGSFLESEVSFDPPAAGEIVDISFMMATAMKILANETIRVVLPGFGGESVESFHALSIPQGAIDKASWHHPSYTLTLTVKQDLCTDNGIYARQLTKVVIPSSTGISLPENGVRMNNSITISTNATSGNVVPTRIKNVQPIGSFLVKNGYARGGPSIEFTNEQTEPTSFTVSFRPQMHLLPGEAITLYLPEFRSTLAGNLTVDFTASPPGSVSKAVFNRTLHTLDLIIGQAVPPDECFVLTVLKSSQIFMRHDGVRWNQSGFALSSKAADGPVLPIDIPKTNAVGTIFGTGIGNDAPFLEYEPRVAGEPAALFLHFVCSMMVGVNETFVIYLPKFTAEAGSFAEVRVELEQPFRSATWYGKTSTLELTPRDSIEPRTALHVMIPSSAGIRLPSQGIRTTHRLTIQIDAQAGQRQPIRVHSDKLGSFSPGLLLRYRSVVHQYTGIKMGKRSEPTELDLTFSPTMNVLPMERLIVNLDLFIGAQNHDIVVVSDPVGSFRNASWMGTEYKLVLTALNGVSAHTLVRIIVPSTFNIRLPTDGVKANQTSLWISTEAADGPVWGPGFYTAASGGLGGYTRSTVITQSDSVGSFRKPRIAWNPPASGAYTGILLQFVPKMQLNPRDTITLFLPNLGGFDSIVKGFTASNFIRTPMAGLWSTSTQLLTLTVSSIVGADTDVAIVVPSTSGIRIPRLGIILNDPQFLIFSDAIDGIIPPTVLGGGIEPVGTILYSSLEFEPRRANTPTTITLQLELEVALGHGDMLSLSLESFHSPLEDRQSITVISNPAGLFDVVWAVADKQTIINLRKTNGKIASRQRFTLIFPLSCGIYTPVNGTTKNNQLFEIAVQSLSGSIAFTPIFYSPAIGAFLWTSLEFSPRTANAESNIMVQIVPSMNLTEGDEIVVRLPGFRGPSCSVAVHSSPPVITTGTWNLVKGEAAFNVARRSDAGQLIVISFPKTEACAIRIPARGISVLKEEQRQFVISSNATNGPVLNSPTEPETQIMHVQHVFALMTSQLSFLPNVAGVSSTLKFEFEPAMNLSRGAEVALLLSGFLSKPFSISNIMSVPAGIFSRALWDSPHGTRQLVLKTALDIRLFTKITVWIPKTSGLTLPTQGMGPEENMLVTIVDSAGSMLPTRIQTVATIPRSAKSARRLNAFEALFLQPPSLSFGTALAGATSGMSLEGHLQGKDLSHLTDIMIHIELPGFTGPESLLFTVQGSLGDDSGKIVNGNWSHITSCVRVCDETAFATTNSSNSSVGIFNLDNSSCPLLVGLDGISCELRCTTATWLELTFNHFSQVTSNQSMAIHIPNTTGIHLPQEGIEAGRSDYVASFTSSSKSNARKLLVSVILNIQLVGFVASTPALEYYPKRSSSVITLMFSFTLAFKLTEFESIFLELPKFAGGTFLDFEVSMNSSSPAQFKAHWTTEGESAHMLSFTLSEGQQIGACQKVTLTLSSSAGLRLPHNALNANDTRLRMHTHGRFGALDSHAIASPAVGSFEGRMSLQPSHRSPSARTTLNVTFTPQMVLAIGDVLSIHLPDFNGVSSDCFPVISEPLGVAVFANWSALDSLLVMKAERQIEPFQVVQVQIPSQSGIFLPKSGLRANQSNISISTNAASGSIERQPVEEVPEIGWFLESDISFSEHDRNAAVGITLQFAVSHLLSVNDTISLFLPGFREEKNLINITTNATIEASWDSVHGPLPTSVPNRQSRIPFLVSSSGVYTHPMTKNDVGHSRSTLPLSYECTPCVTSVVFDGDDLADGYYKSVCGLGASDLWQGLHSLLLSTHRGIEGGSSLRRAIEEVDGIASADQEELMLRLLYTGEQVIRNSSSKLYESKWSPAFAWPQALGVGYQEAACNGLQCDSGHALTDLHHQFPADSKIAELRAKPLHYTTGSDVDVFKASMLFSDCDESCHSDPHAPQVRYSADWRPFVDAFEPPEDTRGVLARALLYMAVRYDGDDGLTDLELKDFKADENPECCFQTDILQGCISPVCYMGQLSTLLRWHVEDPPTLLERERNDRVQQVQGNRNPFVDFPQLSRLLWGNETYLYQKLGKPGSLETLSDCGRDNSSIVHGEWVKDESKLLLTVNRRIERATPVQVTIPSGLGICLPTQGIFGRNISTSSIPSISDPVHGAVHLSVDSIDAPIMMTPVLKCESVGVFRSQPTLEFEPAAFAGEVTSLNFSVMSAVNLLDGDRLILHLPGFSVSKGDIKASQVIQLVTGYALNCSEQCNISCELNATALNESGVNASDLQYLLQQPYDDSHYLNGNLTCWKECSDHCVQIDVLSQFFSGEFIQDRVGISIIITINLNRDAEGAAVKEIWPANEAVSFLITSTAGIQLPRWGVPKKDHNISLNLTRTNCSHLLDEDEKTKCSSSTGGGGFPLVSSVHVKSAGIGSFEDVSLEYLPFIPGKLVELMMELTTKIDLTFGDHILLQLPGFGIASEQGNVYETNTVIFSTSTSQFYAIWSKRCPKDSLILMLLRPSLQNQADISIHSLLNIIVPVRLGIMLPYAHLPKNLNALTIAVQAEDGSMLHRLGSVGNSPGMITLNWKTTEISFTPASAGKATSIRFSFTASDPLKPGDEIMVRLPGFTGPEKDCFPTLAMYPADAITSAAWNATDEILLYRVSNYVDAGERVWVLMDIGAEISLPASGVVDNRKLLSSSPLMPHEQQITVSATTSHGNIHLAPVSIVSPVGQINRSSSSLTFEPMRAGEATEITISIVALMDFDVGDTISLHLPGFTAKKFQHSSDPLQLCILTRGVACNTSFDLKSAMLRMTVCSFAPAGLPAVSVIPMAAGIELPSTFVSSRNADEETDVDHDIESNRGVRDILMSTNAKDGTISENFPVTLGELSAIGKFNQSSLSLGSLAECHGLHDKNSQMSPDSTTGKWKCIKSLLLNFTLDMDLSDGDEIALKLPGFTSIGWFTLIGDNGVCTPLNAGVSEPIETQAANCFALAVNPNLTISDARIINQENTVVFRVLAPIMRMTHIGLNLFADSGKTSGLIPPSNASKNGSLIWQPPHSFTLAVRGRHSQIAPTPVGYADVNYVGFLDSPTAEIVASKNWERFGLKLTFAPAQQLKLDEVITWHFPGIRSRRWGLREVIDDSRRYLKRDITISRGFACQNRSISVVNCSNLPVGSHCLDKDISMRQDHWYNISMSDQAVNITNNQTVDATGTFRYINSLRKDSTSMNCSHHLSLH